MKLRAMKTGQTGTVNAISIQGTLGLRLREMGIIPGTIITMEGRAPLRDPVKIRLHGQVLTLRNKEADHIEMKVQEVGQ
ncbi:MAG TPA: ferrous iron transport protein A [Desulfobulbus sp.]|nr:ferrous iron transport protein A [Desulfobulbus sp.]